jgi:hypothetical protein
MPVQQRLEAPAGKCTEVDTATRNTKKKKQAFFFLEREPALL